MGIHNLASVFFDKLSVLSKGEWVFFPTDYSAEEYRQGYSEKDGSCRKENLISCETGARNINIHPQNNAKYFIDGVEGYAVVGYVSRCTKERRAWPVILGDYGVCCGELYKDVFSIVEYTQGLILVYPEELELDILRAIIESFPRPQVISLRGYTEGEWKWKNALREKREEIEKSFLDSLISNGKGKSYTVVIDGYNSIKKKKPYSNNEMYKADRVIGICKKFDLSFLSKDNKGLSREIADLCENKKETTRLYQDMKRGIWFWFLKLRNSPNPYWDRAVSDVIQCVVAGKDRPKDDIITQWNKTIQQLAYPTCYGLDNKRWRTHIYPIYLTELYGKRMRNTNYLNMLAYGQK